MRQGSVGTRLREARAARGVGLDEAFEHTRINKRFLEALERDAPPEEFPAPVYVRAFLVEYARYLGLDPDPLVESYRREHAAEGVEPAPIRLLRPVEEPRGPWLKLTLLVLSVGALVAIALVAVRATREPVPPTRPGVSVPSPVSPSPPAVQETAEPPERTPPRGIRLAISVEDAPCWIEVTRDEEVLYQETAEPGFSMTFRAPRDGQLDLILGNAGAVTMVLNGERLDPLEAPGGVFEGSVVFEDGEARLIPAG
ncbi:MAG TPA: RodZ domain-containing protein [Actinomycetota bacterium]|nr:RodZ domain-containing protein [Actinomycetota bacterium]